MIGARRILALALGLPMACARTSQPESTASPVNACPAHPCTAYDGGTPACTAGTCVEAVSFAPSRLVLVVSIPDAPMAPSTTFLEPLPLPPSRDGGLGGPASTAVATPVQIRMNALPYGGYTVQDSDTLPTRLNWNLGNPGAFASLPARVTYRPLWASGSTSADAGVPAPVDAVSAGLPVEPVEGETVRNRMWLFPGPGLSDPWFFSSTLQPTEPSIGVVEYEITVAPMAPFDQAYPPEVNKVRVPAMTFPITDLFVKFDSTNQVGDMTPTLPTFDLSRVDGPLDGWTAYLRDQTTKRRLSPVKTLAGATTPDGGIRLPTSHHPEPMPPSGNVDALSNAELVFAPPAGSFIPAAVFGYPNNLSRRQTYVHVPPPISVHGTIEWLDGVPAAADIVFQATSIYAAAPGVPLGDGGPQDDGGSSQPQIHAYPQGFEYAGLAVATRVSDSASSYDVVLPRGQYRVIVRPRDASSADGSAIVHAITVVDGIDTGDGSEVDAGASPPWPALTVGLAPVLSGTAVVADGRPLSDATVEALPIRCFRPPSDAGVGTADSPQCMPRRAQTTTLNGSFSMTLDPGAYLLRVEPAVGTRFPWTVLERPVVVPAVEPVRLVVPAPVYRAFRLYDGSGSPIAYAVVRVFTMPTARAKAVEVGRAVTDATGGFEMYLDPAVQ